MLVLIQQAGRPDLLMIDLLSEAVVDALMRALTHVILGFLRRGKAAVGRYRMNACVEIDVTFPGP